MAAVRIYVRWQPGTPRVTGRPLLRGDALAQDQLCLVCGERIARMVARMVALGPDHPGALLRHREGRCYAALACLVHEVCIDTVTEQAFEQQAQDTLKALGGTMIDLGASIRS